VIVHDYNIIYNLGGNKMIVILKQKVEKNQVDELINWLSTFDVKVNLVEGTHKSILGLIGDTSKIDIESIKAKEIVENVQRIQEPFKNTNRKFHPDDTVIEVEGRKIGGGSFNVIAGPCSVENEEQIITTAEAVKEAGATMLRGGAFKPRTSPYAFQGLRADGIELLLEAKKVTGLPIVTEIMSLAHLDLFADVDIIQVGARNMQNFELLKELGHSNKPILLKRGLANTIEELLMSAEYITAGGNQNIILCERGIRTFEPKTRNTLDISAVPLLKQLSHLPVVVDPSHAAGITSLVEPLSLAAIACGADGLIIEVHNDPKNALSDGAQSLTPVQFANVMKKIKAQAEFSGKPF
jgi:3-deoxy-7-phosphoheptulonate synthase